MMPVTNEYVYMCSVDIWIVMGLDLKSIPHMHKYYGVGFTGINVKHIFLYVCYMCVCVFEFVK